MSSLKDSRKCLLMRTMKKTTNTSTVQLLIQVHYMEIKRKRLQNPMLKLKLRHSIEM